MKSPNRFQRKYDFRPRSGFCLNSSPPSVCPLWLLLKYILGILQSLSTVNYAHGYSPNSSKIFFFILGVLVFCLHVCVCIACMPGAHGDLNVRVPGVVSHHVSAGKWTQVLYKGSPSSIPFSRTLYHHPSATLPGI